MSIRRRARRFIAGAQAGRVVGVVLLAASISAQAPPPPTQPSDVIDHLQLTIEWYREMTAVGQDRQATSDIVSEGRLHQATVDALQLGFDFARAQAALLRTAQPAAQGEPAPGASSMEQANARLTQRIAAAQTRLNDVNTALARAPAKTGPALVAERDTLTANLELLKTIQNNIQQMLRFAATSQLGENAPDSLIAQIDALQRSVPEARHTAQPTTQPRAGGSAAAEPAAPAAAGPRFDPESAGVVSLASELIAMAAARRQLTTVLRTTDRLGESIDARRGPLGASIRRFVRQTTTPAGGAAQPAREADLQTAVARVRQLSTALVPLGEQGIAVDTARTALEDARNDLTARAATAARYLAIRALVLVVAIGVVFTISELWRRATFRYLRDMRRRQQFLLLRRIIVTAAVIVILVIGFVSQIGSLATYAGFVTAGVAVALQNVILAVVAYFFLIGRYGVRVGDRITIGGVTGNVIEIGLVRIYLMEVTSPEWAPTGRIVVFSNAVLFQPAALFKQMPGVDYGWHAVTLTLAAGADLARAEHDIRDAIEPVFEAFRVPIEEQHARLQENVQFQTPVPKPDVQIRVVDEGLVLTVRYPVERTRATEMDNRMMTAIREAVGRAPAIPLTPSGSPRLQEPGQPTSAA